VFTGRTISEVAIDPSSSTHMFAATDGGLYVTSDGGSTWAKPADPSYAVVDGSINGIVIDPVTSTTVYLSGGPSLVAKSTDGGAHWAAANAGIGAPSGSFPFTALAIASSSPSTLYASIGSTGAVGMYKTTNGGAAWATVPVPDFTGQAFSYGSGTDEQGWYDNVVAVDPLNANHVLAGGIALVETIDGGTSWTNVNSKTFFAPGTNKVHPDQHALAFRADSKVWVGDDGGVFLYDPAANTVVNANGNLNITQFYFGFNEVGGALLAGSQDNGVARTNSPSLSAWTGVRAGDGGPSAIVPNSPSVEFIVGNQGLFRTDDAFATTQRNITPPTVGLFTPPMTISANAGTPADPTVFYGGPDLWRSINTSASTPTWTRVTSIRQYVSAIAVSPSNSQVVYVGFTNGVIQVSTDGGVSFASLAAQPFPTTFVTGLSVDPTNPQAITASVSTSDTRSSIGAPHVAQYSYTGLPGSGTWTTITGNLPSSKAVSRVVYVNGALVAATDAGVYATGTASGSSTSWSLVGGGLPAVQVQDLFVDPGSGTLYAVTHGRGAWMLAVPSLCTLTLTGDVQGPVTANSGDSVCITNARVVGPVTVNSGGALTVVNSQISGGVVADNPRLLSLCGSQVSGPSTTPGRGVVVSNAGVPIRIGDPANGCAANTVAGDVTLTSNLGVTLGANTVSGNVTVNSNGPQSTIIKANKIYKVLACAGNTPAPVNAGQVNTAATKSGQCTTL